MIGRLKKLLLSASVIVLFALYSLQQRASQSSFTPTGASVAGAIQPTRTETSRVLVSAALQGGAPSATTPPAPTATTTVSDAGASGDDLSSVEPTATTVSIIPTTAASSAQETGAYRDGTYTGDAANAYWGDVQVQVVVSGGQISEVAFLDYPNTHGRSISINNEAMPTLIQEAISAQSSKVDVVTGATDTSEAFIQSLDSALSQAAS